MNGKTWAVTVFVCALLACPPAAVRAFAADARSAYLAGAAAQGVEDYELAIERYKEALSLNPAYLEPMIGLVAVLHAPGGIRRGVRFVGHGAEATTATIPTSRCSRDGSASAREISPPRGPFSRPCSQRQPNNVEARLGMAEAEVAEGRPKNALSQYAQTLTLAPESTRAVLSLAMLSQETGDDARPPVPTTSSP